MRRVQIDADTSARDQRAAPLEQTAHGEGRDGAEREPATKRMSETMKRKKIYAAAAVVALCGLTSVPTASASDVEDRIAAQLDRMQSTRLHLTVDRPMLRPGETVWFRAFEATTKATGGAIHFQLIDPRGGIANEASIVPEQGNAAHAFDVSESAAGGAYTLTARSSDGTQATRTIIVSAYETPRIKKQLDFAREAYGPGESVEATVEFEKTTGGALKNAKAEALIVVDQVELARMPIELGADGKARVSFELPSQMQAGDGLLTVLVTEGGFTESIQRRIPITLGRIKVELFPEGGDLVSGLTSRVYVRGKTTLGEPADFAGKIVDSTGKVVAEVDTLHDGMGRFEFTPAVQEEYTLEVTRPTSVTTTVGLPSARATGCVLRAHDDYRSRDDDLTMTARCSEERTVYLAAVMRGQLVQVEEFEAGPAGSEVSLDVGGHVGALRTTLFVEDAGSYQPAAERLVYRGLGQSLQVSIESDKERYAPRDKVELTIAVKTARGEPVPNADLALSVVDDTLLSYADDEEPKLLAGILILPEMPGQTIHDPNFYFDPEEQQAPEAMDLLMGTAGWRTFEWSWPGAL